MVYRPDGGTNTRRPYPNAKNPASDWVNVSILHVSADRVWDPDTGNCEAVLSGHGGTIGALCTISWRSPAAVFGGAHRGGETETSGESVIISGSGDSTVRVWGRDGSGSNLGEWACRAVLEGHRCVCVCAYVCLCLYCE